MDLVFLKKILNEIEIAEVQKFVEHNLLFEAVRKVLLAGLYYNGTLKQGEPANPQINFALALALGNPDMSNEKLGSDLRACAEGIRLLESGFRELQKLKVVSKLEPKENIAR